MTEYNPLRRSLTASVQNRLGVCGAFSLCSNQSCNSRTNLFHADWPTVGDFVQAICLLRILVLSWPQRFLGGKERQRCRLEGQSTAALPSSRAATLPCFAASHGWCTPSTAVDEPLRPFVQRFHVNLSFASKQFRAIHVFSFSLSFQSPAWKYRCSSQQNAVSKRNGLNWCVSYFVLSKRSLALFARFSIDRFDPTESEFPREKYKQPCTEH